MTRQQKIYNILADLLDTINDRVINIDPNSENARDINWVYNTYYQNIIYDRYYHDEDRQFISNMLGFVSLESLKTITKEYLREKKYDQAMFVLCRFARVEEYAQEFSDKYQTEMIQIDIPDNTKILEDKIAELEATIKELREYISKLENKTEKFTSDNITEASIKYARIELVKGNRTISSYETLNDLLDTGYDLGKPLNEIVRIFKKQSGDAYRHIVKGQIDIRFFFNK
jgi:polyhydroxyalkanoate synthesis regulator phasin